MLLFICAVLTLESCRMVKNDSDRHLEKWLGRQGGQITKVFESHLQGLALLTQLILLLQEGKLDLIITPSLSSP